MSVCLEFHFLIYFLHIWLCQIMVFVHKFLLVFLCGIEFETYMFFVFRFFIAITIVFIMAFDYFKLLAVE